MENMNEITSVDNSHYATMSAPLILKSLCQHIHNEHNFLKTG